MTRPPAGDLDAIPCPECDGQPIDYECPRCQGEETICGNCLLAHSDCNCDTLDDEDWGQIPEFDPE